MNQEEAQWAEVKAQFDVLPYPNRPLEATPKDDVKYLAKHNIVIPNYLRYKTVIDTKDKWILDAGCGSGFKLLSLALANPGANIVGIDLSQNSLDRTRERLQYHGIQNSVQLHCLPIEQLAELNYQFDYINCDDVLYLLANPTDGLSTFKSVLKPEGIIRANMHSSLQRASFYRAQEFFSRLGFLQGEPTQEEMAITRATMTTLQNWVLTKKQTWSKAFEEQDEVLLMNYLFRGDVGITLTEFSTLLKAAELEFISMVNWQRWNLEDLFKNIEELPIEVALGIAEMTLEEQLQIFELLHPIHRLLDLYCGHPGQGRDRPPVDDWTDEQWRTAVVHFHPQLRTTEFKETLELAAEKLGVIPFQEFLDLDGKPAKVDSSFAACLYPLLAGPQPMTALVQRWLRSRPLDLITLEPANPTQAFELVRDSLTSLEKIGYVMIELDAVA